ncbi:hypothetical protein [Phenylobacterium sp.]|uniref:hypothetical protein n=1 Tax=Phenylobacterium sp. TaxID=1871053 RepID=UPI002EDA7261
MRTQLTKGLRRRVMYVENKNGLIDGAQGRIGWVSFSKTGQTIYYRGRTLQKGRGISGDFFDVESGEEYWVSGVKQRGSNAHPAERGVSIEVDPDALDDYRFIRSA